MSRIRAKNQEKIIEVASLLFAEKGYAATTTAEIALRAEIPKPNLYYYFSSKDKLYRAGLIVAVVTTWMMGITDNFWVWSISRLLAGLSSAKTALKFKYET